MTNIVVKTQKQPWEMTKEEFINPPPLPKPKLNNIILYHRLSKADHLPQVLKEGLLIAKKKPGGEGPSQALWATTSPTGYSKYGTVIGFEVPKTEIVPAGEGQFLIGRDIKPDEIVYVDPQSTLGPGFGNRISDQRKSRYASKIHREYVKRAVLEGRTVPQHVLEEYRGELWADEALRRIREKSTKGKQITSEGSTESIEKGISLDRAREITGDKQPTAWKIRQHFTDMTDSERAIVHHNIEKEIKEIQEDKKIQRELRLNAPKDSKLLYTDRIKQLDKLLAGKKEQLKRLDRLRAKESDETLKRAEHKKIVVKIKQPWEMTREEFEKNPPIGYRFNPYSNSEANVHEIRGIITLGPKFFKLPLEIRKSILMHEKSHALESSFDVNDWGSVIDATQKGLFGTIERNNLIDGAQTPGERITDIFASLQDGEPRWLDISLEGYKKVYDIAKAKGFSIKYNPKNIYSKAQNEIRKNLSEGLPVPYKVLKYYKGQEWADEALKKMERET